MAKTATIHTVGGLGTRVRPAPGRPAPLLVRARARIRRPRLDTLIARAVYVPGDRALALREAELAGERERRRAADRIERVLEDAARRPTFSAAVPIDAKAVEVARPALTELVATLRSGEAVEPRGVALTMRLLTDACSPVYRPPGPRMQDRDALLRVVRRVLLALRPLGAGLPADPSPD